MVEIEFSPKTIVAIYILWLLVAVGGSIGHYNDECYDMYQGQQWLWRARATNDLGDMANNLNKTLEKMEGYSGNPSYIFPSPDTDIDQIRMNIKECVANCQKYSQMDNSMAYQLAVQNLQETIVEIESHVDAVVGWIFWTPFWVFWWVMGMWLWVALILYGIKYGGWC